MTAPDFGTGAARGNAPIVLVAAHEQTGAAKPLIIAGYGSSPTLTLGPRS